MTTQGILILIAGNLRERKARVIAAIGVVGFAVAVGMAVVGLARGFLQGIVAKAEESLPPTLLTVRPRTLNVAMLALDVGQITSETVRQVKSLEGVEWAGEQVSLRMPLRAAGEIAGQRAESDAILAGIDPIVVAEEVDPRFTFQYDEQTSLPIPIIVPRFFIDMFNLAYADMAGLPKIDERFALGRSLDLIIGETVLFGSTGSERGGRFPMRVVGFTSNPSLTAGLLIPSGHARALNAWWTEGRTEGSITGMFVKVDSNQNLDQISNLLRDQNLIVEDTRGRLSQVTVLARAGTAVVMILGLAVAAIAAVAIFNLFALAMQERAGEALLLRAVGGTRRAVAGIYLGEVAVIGLGAGLVGVLGGGGLLIAINTAVVRYLPRVSYLPEQVFIIDGWLISGFLLGSVAFCLLAASPSVRNAVRQSEPGIGSQE
jgi:ABC-type lipoprotein release transport system permease subunit